MQDNEVIRIIEAALMTSKKPITVDKLMELITLGTEIGEAHGLPSKSKLEEFIQQLQDNYRSSSIELVEVSSGYRFQLKPHYSRWVTQLWLEKPQKYSRALLETLALIAYRQPITRGEIEDVRGVSVSSQIIRTLMEREWIRVIGHRDVPGKPAMYATTKHFLDYFSLQRLDQLPPLAELLDVDQINPELDFGLNSASLQEH